MSLTEELIKFALGAPEERKREALRVLRGDMSESKRGLAEVERFVSLGEASAFLGVSRRSVWRWLVPSHRLGTRTRFRLSEVAAYVASDVFTRRLDELKAKRRR